MSIACHATINLERNNIQYKYNIKCLKLLFIYTFFAKLTLCECSTVSLQILMHELWLSFTFFLSKKTSMMWHSDVAGSDAASQP